MDIYPASAQRQALLELVPALGCSDTALRRDECGDPRIAGKHGHIYAVCGSLDEPSKPGFMAYVTCETGMAWTYAKKALSFAQLTNDGDDEGALFLGRLPSKSGGILKKRDIGDAIPSEAQLAARAAFADRGRAQIAAA